MGGDLMQVISDFVCGMDVHKDSITACILAKRKKEIRTFGTMTDDLLLLLDWIQSYGCTHVAMESTGVYWKPIYNLLELEPSIHTYVVNAQHIKNVPGRKTDVKDAEWIADLLKHGLLKPSFIPNRDQRELRELVRYRRSLIDERARESNRIQKVLEGANIKLGSVATDILGVSGRLMLRQLIDGESNPETIAQLAKKQLRKKMDLLQRSLKGLIGEHQRFMLKNQLNHIEYLEKQIKELDNEIGDRLNSAQNDIERLDSIPGVGIQTAQQIIAEIGLDMTRFQSAAHLASWAGMAPGQNESAGKKKTARTRDGNKYLRSALVEAAASAIRVKNSHLSAKYYRLKRRRGTKKARVAIAHQILVIVYHLLTRKENYKELGSKHHDQKALDIKKRRAIKHLSNLGFEVTLTPHSA
jgi:transposase